jgi:hypothetical protein
LAVFYFLSDSDKEKYGYKLSTDEVVDECIVVGYKEDVVRGCG